MPAKTGNYMRVNVYLPPPQDRALRALSRKTGLKYAELVRKAVAAYLPGAIEDAKKQ